MTTNLAPNQTAAIKPSHRAEGAIEQVRPTIEAMLPAGVSFDRFKAVVALAATKSPDVVANVPGLILAAVACAADGLLPDGREAALVVYKGKTTTVQYQPMIGGLIKLARQSGQVSTISARVVRERDAFEYRLGDDERISHVPYLGADEPGKPVCVYAIAVLADGGVEREVMTVREIGLIAGRSRSEKGPWQTDPDEMAKKTVLRRLLKRLPRSAALDSAISRDDTNAVELAQDPRTMPALMQGAEVEADPRAEALARAAEMARDGQDRAMVGAYLDGTELFSEEGVGEALAKVFGK